MCWIRNHRWHTVLCDTCRLEIELYRLGARQAATGNRLGPQNVFERVFIMSGRFYDVPRWLVGFRNLTNLLEFFQLQDVKENELNKLRMEIPQNKDKLLQTVWKMIAKAKYFHMYFMVFLPFSAHHFCSRAQGRAKAPPKPRNPRAPRRWEFWRGVLLKPEPGA